MWQSTDQSCTRVGGRLSGMPRARTVGPTAMRYCRTWVPASWRWLSPGRCDIRRRRAPVESYLDVGDRANFSNAAGTVALFPDFSARMREMAGRAPLVLTGALPEQVKLTLARNAAIVSKKEPPICFGTRGRERA